MNMKYFLAILIIAAAMSFQSCGQSHEAIEAEVSVLTIENSTVKYNYTFTSQEGMHAWAAEITPTSNIIEIKEAGKLIYFFERTLQDTNRLDSYGDERW